jgi:Cu/Ag efflux pump CusA
MLRALFKKYSKKIEAQQFDVGYYATYGGTFENLIAAKERWLLLFLFHCLFLSCYFFCSFKS